jgi:predicted ATP-dependent serine protease
LLVAMHAEKHIITFCKEMDNMLGGGLSRGQITEFCGVPGVSEGINVYCFTFQLNSLTVLACCDVI